MNHWDKHYIGGDRYWDTVPSLHNHWETLDKIVSSQWVFCLHHYAPHPSAKPQTLDPQHPYGLNGYRWEPMIGGRLLYFSSFLSSAVQQLTLVLGWHGSVWRSKSVWIGCIPHKQMTWLPWSQSHSHLVSFHLTSLILMVLDRKECEQMSILFSWCHSEHYYYYYYLLLLFLLLLLILLLLL